MASPGARPLRGLPGVCRGARGTGPWCSGRRAGAPARELHRQPLRRDRALGRACIHPLCPRPGRGADVPGRRRCEGSRLPGGRGEEARAHSRRPPCPARCSRASGCGSPGGGWTQDAPLRRRVFGRGDRQPARLPRHQLRAPDRLARGDRCCAGRRAGAHVLGAGCQRKRRAALLSGRPAALSARRDRRPGARCLRLRHGSAAELRPGRAAKPSPRWLRSADREGRSLARHRPPFALDRGLLGRGPRAYARSWQGPGRRLPDRDERQAARRSASRRNGHRDAHRRRLRSGSCHARCSLSSSSPRASTPG